MQNTRANHSSRSDPDAVWPALRQDRLALFGGALLLAVAIPYFVPRLGADTLEVYGDFYSDTPLIVFLILLSQMAARATPHVSERRFWHLVSGALGCWLAVRAINIGWLLNLPLGGVVESDVTGDVIYIGFYLFLAVALEIQPHRRRPRTARVAQRAIKAAGAIVMLLALVTYFVIIPWAVNPAAYETWVPSLLLYVTLDAYLILRLAGLAYSRPGKLWGRVYRWMLLTAGLWLVTDALETLFYAGVLPWVRTGTLLDLVWLPPFATMMVAARTPVHWRRSGGGGSAMDAAITADPLARLWGGPLVLYAVALPLIHFGLYGIAALDPVSRVPRENLSFVAIAVLAALAWRYQRLIEGENRRLAADLRALAAQLRPHFLFNTLNSLSALLRRDPSAAEGGLIGLGNLLRYTLEETRGELVHLAEEWKFTCAYLELERLRLGEQLSLKAELADEAAGCLVPRFILQPLVENAVRHAAAARSGGARIEIRAWAEGEAVRIVVNDDGPGADPAAVMVAPGLGLRAVQAQLDAHYGDRAVLDIQTAPGAGFRAAVRLPAEVD